MKAVSDKRGVIAAAAMDQRGSLQKALAKEKGADVGPSMLEEFKSVVTEVLTPHASAILLDPEFGLPAAKRRSKNAGLLLRQDAHRSEHRDQPVSWIVPTTRRVTRVSIAGRFLTASLWYASRSLFIEFNNAVCL